MSTPYLGEIKLVTFNFAPRGWALCNGQLLAISQNQALFSILGTTYGGDGLTTFALPDFRGRVPLHTGPSVSLGQSGGETAHTLSLGEMAPHSHGTNGAPVAPDRPGPSGNVWAQTDSAYSTASGDTTLNGTGCAPAGGAQAHPNLPPYLVLNFVIALQGIFPTRN